MNKIDFLWEKLITSNVIDCTTYITKITDSGTYDNGMEFETTESEPITDDVVILNSLCFGGNVITFNTKKNQSVVIDETSDIEFSKFYVSIKCGKEKLYILILKIVTILDLEKLYELR